MAGWRESGRWAPDVGDEVWWNHPDSGRVGRVVGTVTDELPHRQGQPIIEKDDGERVVIHPQFLLPFEYHGAEWLRAKAEGQIG
jgi:hypothetical protein